MFIKGALSSFWRVFEFYRQGFSAMRLGKTLWGGVNYSRWQYLEKLFEHCIKVNRSFTGKVLAR